MKTILLNVLWLINVSVVTNNAYGQITTEPRDNAKLYLTCDELANLPLPIAKTTCNGVLQFTYTDLLRSGGCMGTIERTYVIKDDCNNTKTLISYITIQDKEGPILSNYPEDITVSLNAIPEAPEISALDNCSGNLKVTFSEKENVDEKGILVSLIRNWTVKDKCQNISQHTQTISIAKNES